MCFHDVTCGSPLHKIDKTTDVISGMSQMKRPVRTESHPENRSIQPTVLCCNTIVNAVGHNHPLSDICHQTPTEWQHQVDVDLYKYIFKTIIFTASKCAACCAVFVALMDHHSARAVRGHLSFALGYDPDVLIPRCKSSSVLPLFLLDGIIWMQWNNQRSSLSRHHNPEWCLVNLFFLL